MFLCAQSRLPSVGPCNDLGDNERRNSARLNKNASQIGSLGDLFYPRTASQGCRHSTRLLRKKRQRQQIQRLVEFGKIIETVTFSQFRRQESDDYVDDYGN